MITPKKIILIMLAFIIGLGVGWVLAAKQMPTDSIANALKRPDGPRGRDLSACIPGHGVHWANPESLGPDKPVSVTWNHLPKTGEVVGVERHFRIEDLQNYNIKELYPTGNYRQPASLPLYGASYDHMTISWTPSHPGMEFPHLDVHAFTKSHEVLSGACEGVEGSLPAQGPEGGTHGTITP